MVQQPPFCLISGALQLDLQAGDDACAAGAEALGVGIQGVHPAAGALLALGLGHADGQVSEVGTDSGNGSISACGRINRIPA